jgi:hypothetical protein
MLTGMAHTPEQRSKQPLCGAKKKNGEPCRLFAGQGTEHKGYGRCKKHGGSTPNHNKHAVALELKHKMIMLGEPVEDVTAVEALLQELYASTGHVAWLRQEISSMDDDDLGTPTGQALISLYNNERDRKVRIAKLATEAGLDEAQVRIAEAQVLLLAGALKRAADAVNMPVAMQRKLGAKLREELSAVEPQTRRVAVA